jgi:hypothetical protein
MRNCLHESSCLLYLTFVEAVFPDASMHLTGPTRDAAAIPAAGALHGLGVAAAGVAGLLLQRAHRRRERAHRAAPAGLPPPVLPRQVRLFVLGFCLSKRLLPGKHKFLASQLVAPDVMLECACPTCMAHHAGHQQRAFMQGSCIVCRTDMHCCIHCASTSCRTWCLPDKVSLLQVPHHSRGG